MQYYNLFITKIIIIQRWWRKVIIIKNNKMEKNIEK